MSTCKSCQYWKPDQSELNYNSHYGICVHPTLKLDSSVDTGVIVLDRGNRPSVDGHANNCNHFECIEAYLRTSKSRYCLVTDEKFGCVNHKNKNK